MALREGHYVLDTEAACSQLSMLPCPLPPPPGRGLPGASLGGDHCASCSMVISIDVSQEGLLASGQELCVFYVCSFGARDRTWYLVDNERS